MLDEDDDTGYLLDASLTFTPTVSGTYYIAVSEGSDSDIGTYTVKVNAAVPIADDYAGSASTTGTLTVGGSRSGAIESEGDYDWFRISLTAGTTYRF